MCPPDPSPRRPPGPARPTRRRRRESPVVDRYLDKFLTYLKVERNASPHTLTNYTRDLVGLRQFLTAPTAGTAAAGAAFEWPSVDLVALRRYVADQRTRGAAKSSIARRIAAIRSFFRFLCREGHLTANPAAGLTEGRAPCRIFSPGRT